MPAALMDELQKNLIEMRRKGIPTDRIAETLNLSTDTVIWLLTHLDIGKAEGSSPADVLVDWSTIGGQPERINLLGKMMTSLMRERIASLGEVDAVYGLTYDGLPLGQAVAHDLGKPFVIVKTQGELEFFSAFFDPKGKRIILVDHVINTGRTLTRVIERLRETDTKPLGVFVFVDKRPWKKDEEHVAGVPTHSLVRAIKA
jgi:orotate phosphoribosyltransferase-like protein